MPNLLLLSTIGRILLRGLLVNKGVKLLIAISSLTIRCRAINPLGSIVLSY
jgi:hypothetical protein